jgi:hypothetical protein
MTNRKVDWKYISYIEEQGHTIFDKENGVYFDVGGNKKHSSCCWCCASNVFVAALVKEGDDFHIKRYGFQQLQMVPDDADFACPGHDDMNDGEHPIPNYKQMIDSNPEHEYYLFLKKKLSENNGKFSHDSEGKDEYSVLYLLIKYIDDGQFKG